MSLLLHGYWRSGAAFRVRIALNLKGLSYEQVSHDLRAGAQRDAEYLRLAPQGLVPAIEADGAVITQSPAILEWIEERWPEPPLLPSDTDDRAVVRSMAALVGCDIHPLNNLRVLQALESDFGADADARKAWISRWIRDGFEALETLVAEHGNGFCFGQAPTLADCYLVPQIYSARRFGIAIDSFTRLLRAEENALRLDAFAFARPEVQTDAPQ